MAQNLYDKQDFFGEYAKLPRSVHGLNSAPEWPTLRWMVGDVKDASVLDLGSGYGWFCRWARGAGAKSVYGIDVSKNMIARAQTFPPDQGITYECRDLEGITLPVAAYNVVYSSLTLHYLPDLGSLFAEVARCLKPGGRFVFSVEHPMGTAPSDANWKTDDEGNLFWPLNCYIDEGLRVTNWLGEATVRKYHHTIETYLSQLIDKGFELKVYRDFWDGMERKSAPRDRNSGHCPYFLLIGAQIRGS